MVAVVQSVEHQIVILGVVGSSPISHPIFRNIYFSENLRKKSIILKPRVNLLGLFFVQNSRFIFYNYRNKNASKVSRRL